MNKKKTLYLMYAIMFIGAFGYIMYSALMTPLRVKYSMTAMQAGMIGSCLMAGQVAILLLTGLLNKRLKKTQLITLGVILSVISLVLIPVAQDYVFLLISFFINGMVCSLLNVSCCAYISDHFPDEREKYINGFHTVYGIGSLLGPLLPSFLLTRQLKWELGYFLIAGLSAVLLVVWLHYNRKSLDTGAKEEVLKEKSPFFITLLFKKKYMALICICGMMLIGFDMIISTWLVTYVEDNLQIVTGAAGIIVTCYWLGNALGRVIYGIVFSKYDSKRYLLFVNGVGVLVLFAGLLIENLYVLFAAFILIGMLVAANYPLCISIACEFVPDNSIGATNALCFCASAGGMIFSMLAGKLMEAIGSWMLLVLGMTMLFVISAIMMYLSRRLRHS